MVALNTADAAPKNAADSKNRVGDFFYEDHASVGKNRWVSRLNTQEKSCYHYESASGRSNLPNRDPIQELAFLNLNHYAKDYLRYLEVFERETGYFFIGNNGIDFYDYLGLQGCKVRTISERTDLTGEDSVGSHTCHCGSAGRYAVSGSITVSGIILSASGSVSCDLLGKTGDGYEEHGLFLRYSYDEIKKERYGNGCRSPGFFYVRDNISKLGTSSKIVGSKSCCQN